MKKLVFIIAGIDIVLLAVCMFLYLGKDRTAPVISFGENAVSYEEGMDERLLLQGVVAMDEKDGDVSDSLLVEKIAGTNGKEVIVTYVARDSANNVGKASRAFPVAGSYMGGDVLPAAGEGLDDEYGMDESETETETESNEESSSVPDDVDRNDAEEERNGGDGEEGRQQDEEPQERQEPQAGPNPVLVTSGEVVSTKIGTAPNWGQVIAAMTDDKDDYNTLYNNLKLEGHVDLNAAGEYPVTLYTVDSDGNRSEVRDLVVRVEE
ncbi:hypothetical protein [Eisenbergiella tayi]|uniref:hypothetical protein n=1 Tax=Eisenbergiella tayi TaxID=1432052 RepID=UPI0008487330|nr:hypothetical protein [Eisenbergiella tayi]ODR34966.1 hypothetical protein BEI60_17895 [Eisenbergiella tayi]